MRIWDQGEPFDFQAKLKESLCQKEKFDPLEQEGGRGLIFMYQLMDEVDYIRLPDQRNCLLLRKHR
jgi:serine/threonine-protein kinase RsbW